MSPSIDEFVTMEEIKMFSLLLNVRYSSPIEHQFVCYFNRVEITKSLYKYDKQFPISL